MLATLVQRFDKNHLFQEREANLNFTGCQVPHFDCINTMYQFIQPFLDNEIMSTFKEYGAFNICYSFVQFF